MPIWRRKRRSQRKLSALTSDWRATRSVKISISFWNDGLAIKSRGRPVFFLHRQAIETLLGRKLDESEREVQTVADLLPVQENQATDDPFSGLIGYDRSLRDAVEKGRAAVLYPHGLHVLLTGPSGVGKTFLPN